MNKNTFKSIGAVLGGIITIVVLSTVTDIVLERNGFMAIPFLGNAWWIILLALIYRSIYTVAGGTVTAALAPRRPMRHAIILGIIGTVLGTIGAIASWDQAPAWFMIGIIVTALPCSWLGGKLKTKNTTVANTQQIGKDETTYPH